MKKWKSVVSASLATAMLVTSPSIANLPVVNEVVLGTVVQATGLSGYDVVAPEIENGIIYYVPMPAEQDQSKRAIVGVEETASAYNEDTCTLNLTIPAVGSADNGYVKDIDFSAYILGLFETTGLNLATGLANTNGVMTLNIDFTNVTDGGDAINILQDCFAGLDNLADVTDVKVNIYGGQPNIQANAFPNKVSEVVITSSAAQFATGCFGTNPDLKIKCANSDVKKALEDAGYNNGEVEFDIDLSLELKDTSPITLELQDTTMDLALDTELSNGKTLADAIKEKVQIVDFDNMSEAFKADFLNTDGTFNTDLLKVQFAVKDDEGKYTALTTDARTGLKAGTYTAVVDLDGGITVDLDQYGYTASVVNALDGTLTMNNAVAVSIVIQGKQSDAILTTNGVSYNEDLTEDSLNLVVTPEAAKGSVTYKFALTANPADADTVEGIDAFNEKDALGFYVFRDDTVYNKYYVKAFVTGKDGYEDSETDWVAIAVVAGSDSFSTKPELVSNEVDFGSEVKVKSYGVSAATGNAGKLSGVVGLDTLAKNLADVYTTNSPTGATVDADTAIGKFLSSYGTSEVQTAIGSGKSWKSLLAGDMDWTDLIDDSVEDTWLSTVKYEKGTYAGKSLIEVMCENNEPLFGLVDYENLADFNAWATGDPDLTDSEDAIGKWFCLFETETGTNYTTAYAQVEFSIVKATGRIVPIFESEYEYGPTFSLEMRLMDADGEGYTVLTPDKYTYKLKKLNDNGKYVEISVNNATQLTKGLYSLEIETKDNITGIEPFSGTYAIKVTECVDTLTDIVVSATDNTWNYKAYDNYVTVPSRAGKSDREPEIAIYTCDDATITDLKAVADINVKVKELVDGKKLSATDYTYADIASIPAGNYVIVASVPEVADKYTSAFVGNYFVVGKQAAEYDLVLDAEGYNTHQTSYIVPYRKAGYAAKLQAKAGVTPELSAYDIVIEYKDAAGESISGIPSTPGQYTVTASYKAENDQNGYEEIEGFTLVISPETPNAELYVDVNNDNVGNDTPDTENNATRTVDFKDNNTKIELNNIAVYKATYKDAAYEAAIRKIDSTADIVSADKVKYNYYLASEYYDLDGMYKKLTQVSEAKGAGVYLIVPEYTDAATAQTYDDLQPIALEIVADEREFSLTWADDKGVADPDDSGVANIAYDGKAHTIVKDTVLDVSDIEYDITITDENGDPVTGAITNVGTYTVTVTDKVDAADAENGREHNYVEKVYTLKITKATNKITTLKFDAAQNTWPYSTAVEDVPELTIEADFDVDKVVYSFKKDDPTLDYVVDYTSLDELYDALKGQPAGSYKLKATIPASLDGNYDESSREIAFAIERASNAWVKGPGFGEDYAKTKTLGYASVTFAALDIKYESKYGNDNVVLEYKKASDADSAYTTLDATSLPSELGDYVIRVSCPEDTNGNYSNIKALLNFTIEAEKDVYVISVDGNEKSKVAEAGNIEPEEIALGQSVGANNSGNYIDITTVSGNTVKLVIKDSTGKVVNNFDKVGEYTVYVSIDEVNNTNYTKLSQKSFKVTVKEGSLAFVNGNDNPFGDGFAFTWKYGETPDFTNAKAKVLVNGTNANGTSAINADISFEYSTEIDGTYTSELPTAVGVYYVRVTASADNYAAITSVPSNKAQFEITKNEVDPNFDISMKDWAYGTSEDPDITVSDDNDYDKSKVEISYKGSNGVSFTEKPTALGKYTVTVKIPESTNYGEQTKSVEFSIVEAEDEISVAIEGWTYSQYDAEKNKLNVTTGNNDKYTTTYYLYKNDNWVEINTVDETSDAGKYKVVVTTEAGNNYKVVDDECEFEIAVFEEELTLDMQNWVYDGEAKAPVVELASKRDVAEVVKYEYFDARKNPIGTECPTAVGEYTVRAYTETTNNYTADEAEKTFAITAAEDEITIEIEDSIVYDGEVHKATVSSKAGQEVTVKYYKDGVELSTNEQPKDAGNYSVVATTPEGDYKAVEAKKSFVITPAEDTITVSIGEKELTETVADNSFVYDGELKVVTGSADSKSDVSIEYFDKDNNILANPPVDAGTYTVKASTQAGNYKAVSVTRTFTITPAEDSLTVKIGETVLDENAENNTFEYDTTKKTVKAESANKQAVEVVYYDANDNVLSSAPKDAGTYKVVAKTEEGDYEAVEVERTFTITPADDEITISLSKTEYVYGEQIAAPEVTVDSGSIATIYYVDSEGNKLNEVPKNAGTYKVVAETKEGNYKAAKAEKEFVINPADDIINITISDSTYGEPVKTPVASAKSGDDVTFTYFAVDADGNRTEVETPVNAGKYVVVGSTSGTFDTNYKAGSAEANFEIIKAKDTINVSMIGWIYGDTAKTPQVIAKSGRKDYTLTYFDENNNQLDKAPTNAGTYRVEAKTADGENYYGTEGYAIYTIGEAEDGIAVSIEDWVYNSAASTPVITKKDDNKSEIEYSYYDNLGNALTGVPTEVGTYRLKAVSKGDGNYKASEAITSFKITPADNTITVNLDGWTYGDYANIPTATATSGEGTVFTFTYYDANGNQLPGVPTNAGTYTVKASTQAGNYKAAEGTKEFTIAQATDNVQISINSWTYGEVAKSPAAKTTSGADVEFTYYDSEGNQLSGAPTDAGAYSVKATTVGAVNYKQASATANFEIAKAEDGVTITMDNWTYGDTAKTPTVLVKSGAVASIRYYDATGKLLTEVPKNAGTYKVEAETDGKGNYKAAKDSVSFTITKAANLFTIEPSIKNWVESDTDGENPTGAAKFGAISYSYGTDKNGDFVEKRPVTIGTYYLKAQVEATDNYDGLERIVEFKINPDESSFNDVDPDTWQYIPVSYVFNRGIMVGYAGEGFGPNDELRREAFAQILYSLSGRPEVNIENYFYDVEDDEWYTKAVLWSKEMGIANGYGKGKYGVGDCISRQDMAVMIYKYITIFNPELADNFDYSELDYFDDSDQIATYAEKALAWCVTNKLMAGKGTKLDPTSTTTRAECAAVLRSMCLKFGL